MDNWQKTLDGARSRTGVTGASFAYWDGQALHTAQSGVRNSVTGDPVTPYSSTPGYDNTRSAPTPGLRLTIPSR